MTRYFGTDGIRDIAGRGRLAPRHVLAAGWALARFAQGSTPGRDVRLVVGRDPRPTGLDMAGLLAGGMLAAGARVEDAGILPTPTLAWSTAQGGYDLGCMLSASHNPANYNGIKPFSARAEKLSASDEADIEALMSHAPGDLAAREGSLPGAPDWVDRYVQQTAALLAQAGRLDGLRVVLDLAAGAATATAPALFEALGAEVHALHPAGSRPINEACGSEHPEAWLAALSEHPGWLGVAFDGDADRVLVAAEDGATLDGDDMLSVLARAHLARDGELPGGCVVGTVMSNMGLGELLTRHGVALQRASVGDRHVAALMREHGAIYGGEPSGHIVLPRTDLAGAPLIGDAAVAAVRIVQAARALNQPLAALRRERRRFPQRLVNVRMAERIPLDAWPRFQEAWREQEQSLGEAGRLVIRYSGTEPLLRIMGEGRESSLVDEAVESLAAVARDAAAG